jgi:hypothetical protein
VPSARIARRRASLEQLAGLPPHWKVVASGLVAAAVLAALNGLHALGVDADLLSIERQASLMTAATVVQLLAAALLCLLATRAAGDDAQAWGSLAALTAILAVDEATLAHEELKRLIDSSGAAPAVEPVIVLAAVAVVLRAARPFPRLESRLLLAAAAALLLSEAADSTGEAAELPHAVAVALVVVEELPELLFGTLVLAATSARVDHYRRSRVVPS